MKKGIIISSVGCAAAAIASVVVCLLRRKKYSVVEVENERD